MPRVVAIGKQDFGAVIENHWFYVDKTGFIKEWWENGDDVTLITRPRRFGKTLTLNMTEYFFHSDTGEAVCSTDWISGKRKNTEDCRGRIRSFF